jgi:hypothetical protein
MSHSQSWFKPIFVCLALFALTVCVLAQGAPSISFKAPEAWVTQKSSSAMRVAQYTLPHVDGDTEDASLVVYFFGTGGGGVQANLDRWTSQMSQPDGSASKEKAKINKFDSHGLKITTIDVTGTYIAEVAPGATERYNKPDFRLRAAVIETAGNPYYVKFTGPAKTMAKWNSSFEEFLKTFELKSGA